MSSAHIATPTPEVLEKLRADVRAFLAREGANGASAGWYRSWEGHDPAFSRKLGQQGWLGMTWPKRYGGHERSMLERYVVIEELLAASAPVSAHWIADRQTGPLLLKVGTEAQRMKYLPAIAAGECFFAIGMSEPDSGSDLASVRTRATKVEGGWRISGRKLWSSHAMEAHCMITLLRTSPADKDRRAGLSQLIVDLSGPGIERRPVLNLDGEPNFAEVTFDDAFVSDDALVGTEGQGWQQVMSELAFERSGPERFLSTIKLLTELMGVIGPQPSRATQAAIGKAAARLMVLRDMSLNIADLMQAGKPADMEASLVKDLGALFEQELPDVVRTILADEPQVRSTEVFQSLLGYGVKHAPSFSIRGGTREVLRGIIARGLGLR